MGLFNKNKKDNKKEAATEEIRRENENRVYYDGAFEVFENTDDGKKYGRIINGRDNSKVYEMDDAEFELWRDASQNFSKYHITFERDEDFFIEKVSIALAEQKIPEKTPEKVEQVQKTIPFSDEDKQEFSALVEFYNNAIKADGLEKSTNLKADLYESIATATLCERKINELVQKAKKETPEGEKVKVQVPKGSA